ncbi:unnamed protein product, partial [Medioppia subpectinata]
MTVDDAVDLVNSEPKLKKWSLYCLIACLVVGVVFVIWYILRYNKGDPAISGIWSLIHVGVYGAFTVIAVLGLIGNICTKVQYLNWFLIGCLALMCFEVVCIFNNMVLSAADKKYGALVLLAKVVVLVVLIVTVVFVYLLKRVIDKNAGKPDSQSAGEK